MAWPEVLCWRDLPASSAGPSDTQPWRSGPSPGQWSCTTSLPSTFSLVGFSQQNAFVSSSFFSPFYFENTVSTSAEWQQRLCLSTVHSGRMQSKIVFLKIFFYMVMLSLYLHSYHFVYYRKSPQHFSLYLFDTRLSDCQFKKITTSSTVLQCWKLLSEERTVITMVCCAHRLRVRVLQVTWRINVWVLEMHVRPE